MSTCQQLQLDFQLESDLRDVFEVGGGLLLELMLGLMMLGLSFNSELNDGALCSSFLKVDLAKFHVWDFAP